MRSTLAMTMLLAATAVEAQIRLPAQLPAFPSPQIGVLNGLNPDPLELRKLGDIRRNAISRLVRGHRDTVEQDPAGEPIVRGEVLAVDIDDRTLARWEAIGYSTEHDEILPAAGLRATVLRVPANLTTRKALDALRDADGRGTYDYNHIYLESGLAENPPAPNPLARAPASTPPPPLAQTRVGLIDAGVDDTHPAFRGSEIRFWGCAAKRVPSAHGTAVASLLTARGAAQLYAADVYCGEATGGSVDRVAAALGWMAEQQVAVINVSLVGPRNLLLEHAVGALIARGHLIVAAVGNDGPAAPPLYPAAYPGVVGVTGVDAQRRVLIEAERGPQVMFAAPGADIEAGNLEHGFGAVRGTSFASPTVAALLAGWVFTPDRKVSLDALDRLARRAIPLGAPGRNLTYGFGFVAAEAR